MKNWLFLLIFPLLQQVPLSSREAMAWRTGGVTGGPSSIIIAYLTFMQNTSCEVPGWMKHKLESRLPGEILITSDIQMTLPLWQKVKRN